MVGGAALRKAGTGKRSFCLASFFLFVVPCAALAAVFEIPAGSRAAHAEDGLGDAATPNIVDRRPKYARVTGSIETFWQRPAGPIAGVLFLAHGCQHQAPDFFCKNHMDHPFQFEGCDKSYFSRCLCLPEERQFIAAARTRNYLVVTVSGGSGRQSCWDMENDPGHVEKALRHIFQIEGLRLGQMPILATGASSGGAFMGPLALHLSSVDNFNQSLRCVVPQISHVGQDAASRITVPTFFLPMTRDWMTMQEVDADVAALHKTGVRVEKQMVDDVPVVDELRQHNVKNWQQVVSKLHDEGLLDESGKLKDDPRRSRWRDVIRTVVDKEDGLVHDESAMAELLNVAYAQHEFTARYANKVLDFCEGR